jgi:hypothetical protein
MSSLLSTVDYTGDRRLPLLGEVTITAGNSGSDKYFRSAGGTYTWILFSKKWNKDPQFCDFLFLKMLKNIHNVEDTNEGQYSQ